MNHQNQNQNSNKDKSNQSYPNQEPFKKVKPSEFPEIETNPTPDSDLQMDKRRSEAPVRQKAPGDTI